MSNFLDHFPPTTRYLPYLLHFPTVHDGRNLDYRVPGSKKSTLLPDIFISLFLPILAPQTRRWRVIFIGGEKKQATSIVDEQDGFPRWDCEVLM